MKIALLGTGFGQARAAVYAGRADIDDICLPAGCTTNRNLRRTTAERRLGDLKVLEIEGRTALLWPGYDLTLPTLVLDMTHTDFDLVTGLLGRPSTVHAAGVDGPAGRGSAADIILGYPHALARCASSALMATPYGVRGGWRATFTGGVLEYAMRAGFTGRGPVTTSLGASWSYGR